MHASLYLAAAHNMAIGANYLNLVQEYIFPRTRGESNGKEKFLVINETEQLCAM